ncbi:MAG: HEPN domain-containing protein [Candidatus Lokiarchaeia archaeon]
MAISDLERVTRKFESEDYAATVYRAQVAAERLCKGIIFLIGLQFKKTHEPTVIIKNFLDEETLEEAQKELLSEIITKAKILEEQGTIPRYGIETPTTILRPEEVYDRKKTLDIIRATNDLVETFIRLLENQKILPEVQSELRRAKNELSKLLQN